MVEIEYEVVEPQPKRDQWLPYWERYLKKIPKRGLNNLARKTSHHTHRRKGEPTLPSRLRKILIGWLGSLNSTLPFFFYFGAMASQGIETENLPKIQECTKQILKKLEALYDNMDTVHVLPKDEVEHWKERIRKTMIYIRKYSRWIGLELLQEADFEVLED